MSGSNESNKDLNREYQHFKQIKNDLLQQGNEGKFALIKGESLIDIFHSEKDAYEAGVKRFGTDIFLVQKISKEEAVESVQQLLHVL